MKSKNINSILQILEGWVVDYPSLVVTLLWQLELFVIQRGDIEGSNKFKNMRCIAYAHLIEKYKEIDPEGMEIFDHERLRCFAIRKMLPPEIVAKRESERKEPKFYEYVPEAKESLHIEKYEESFSKTLAEFIEKQTPGIKSMFSFRYARKEFDESEDRSILDILEAIAYDEEKHSLVAEDTPFYEVFYDRNHIGFHEDSLKFRGIVGYDGKLHLCPFKTIFGLLYRGQNAYYSKCYASIDRGLSESDIFKERLKTIAIEKLCCHHPCLSVFNNGREEALLKDKGEYRQYYVDYLALAQHYGISTNLLDLTSDKMIAAFFACTGYNRRDDKYYPYSKRGKGVFYVYRDRNIFSENSRLSCVGLQPLSRPGAQSGYVVSLNREEDFNLLCSEAISFAHDKQVARLIFKLVNLLNEPFVDDVMSQKANFICRSTTFSRDVLKETVSRWYSTTDSATINQWIINAGVMINDDIEYGFSKADQEKLDVEANDILRQLESLVYTKSVFYLPFDEE